MTNDVRTVSNNLVSKDYDAGLLFSGKASGKSIAGFEPNELAPATDPTYEANPDFFRDLIVWAQTPAFQPL